ncbi:putative telomere silencing protein [Botrytis fragariae]|uniref:Putative telomere silencing protein n=1 Tax=Botrytis fragariae TaxID=1964551 RepID=A0A8H6AMZ1_9HELO|nr:putative telomere silencing protein [Botrytis fragariae]KAF5870336.1 putative telomere silencing protein [Botrytis fragariae]
MKTSSRPREQLGGSFAPRRDPRISINDPNHHVTEAIGDMYGDDDYSKQDSRPLSFMPSSSSESIEEVTNSFYDTNSSIRPRPVPLVNGNHKAHTSPAIMQSPRSPTFGDGGPISPSLSLRDPNAGGTANAEFPLNDIDYESGPAAVAQELSNLQALRRMSMDVGNTSDPDLPSFQGVSSMPTAAPTGNDNEDDPSRLFWVPARVHPELAPMEFKTFLENRVQSIKRRSGDQISLTANGVDQSGSGAGLRRKKSMLSRQIDNSGGKGAIGYQDGAEHLERKKSLSSHHTPDLRISDLQELDELVKDPSKAMQKLNLDTGRGEGAQGEDLPILPQAPGIGLRRSTHTTYRRGSLRKGERVPFSKRAGSIRADTDGGDSPTASPIDGRPSAGYPLTHTLSEPSSNTDNFSRPNRGARRMQNIDQVPPVPPIPGNVANEVPTRSDSPASTLNAEILPNASQQSSPPAPDATRSRSTSHPRTDSPVPRIIETPPPVEETPEPQMGKQSLQYPERTSSQTTQVSPKQHASPVIPQAAPQVAPQAASQAAPQAAPQSIPEPPARSNKRPVLERQASSGGANLPKTSTANDMPQHQQSSSLPVNSLKTDTLTHIPTSDDKKIDKKSKKEREEENSGTRKTSWGWFKGSDEKDKKDKKKDDKNKSKVSSEKVHDNARLDVLQSTMETTTRGRESFLVERENVDNKLENERKKESSRKAGGEPKKEKDGIFSSLFGGGKKKADRDSGGKKGSSLRTLSPEPPQRILKPDIDYNWTRFSIMEERAIYRMAHIKLANPKRALYSQVLLSNFMYSYLAKVQQMHPHMQVPQSVQQKKAEAERKQKEQEQRYLEQQEQLRQQQQQQQQPEGDQYRYDYHQGITQYAEQSQNPNHSGEAVNYVDDSQIYDYDHQGGESEQDHNRPQSRTGQNNSENGYNDQNQKYYDYGRTQSHDQAADDGEMW